MAIISVPHQISIPLHKYPDTILSSFFHCPKTNYMYTLPFFLFHRYGEVRTSRFRIECKHANAGPVIVCEVLSLDLCSSYKLWLTC